MGGDSGLIWAGHVADFAELDKKAAEYNAQFILVDCRYRTQEVNEWCAGHAGYIPCLGQQRTGATIFSVNTIDMDSGHRGGNGRLIEVISHNPDQLKNILADQMQQATGARRWLVPTYYSQNAAYCEQMTAEKNINGKWQPIPAAKPNHYWDAEVLNLLAAIRFQVWQTNMGQEEEKK
jgi:hypothetical protein